MMMNLNNEDDLIIKECNNCGHPKPLTDYNKRASATDGHKADCRACCILMGADYQDRNRDKINEYNRKKSIKLKEEKQQFEKEHPEIIIKRKKIKAEKSKKLKIALKKRQAKKARLRYSKLDENGKIKLYIKDKKNFKNAVDNLSDAYIRKLLRKQKSHIGLPITEKIVEMKREQVIAKRLLTKYSKECNYENR